MSVRHRLQEIYNRLPVVRCQGKCLDSCGPIACSKAERSMMERRAGRPLTYDPETATCGYLNAEGRCDVYRDRPFVCRAWGASAKMPCTFGCVPETPYLSEEAEHALFVKVIEIGGEPSLAKPKEREP